MNLREQLRGTVSAVERKNGIPQGLLAQLLNYNEAAIAGKGRHRLGAIGIARLTPDIGKRYGMVTHKGDDRTYIHGSIEVAGRYIRDLYARFGNWRRAAVEFSGTTRRDFIERLPV